VDKNVTAITSLLKNNYRYGLNTYNFRGDSKIFGVKCARPA
jgi:hypothetical protein